MTPYCPTCKEPFRSLSLFDQHRVGSFSEGRRCLTPEEMLEKGWIRRPSTWIGSERPSDLVERLRSGGEKE